MGPDAGRIKITAQNAKNAESRTISGSSGGSKVRMLKRPERYANCSVIE
jgi:hypothetical protein